mmetsp:Transcript_16886/g.23847  ORF Transcript_16886/g.23847 Transcript_16886/m.23847 type:complete len:230 (-) Transcript_16886:835-1524(-)
MIIAYQTTTNTPQKHSLKKIMPFEGGEVLMAGAAKAGVTATTTKLVTTWFQTHKWLSIGIALLITPSIAILQAGFFLAQYRLKYRDRPVPVVPVHGVVVVSPDSWEDDDDDDARHNGLVVDENGDGMLSSSRAGAASRSSTSSSSSSSSTTTSLGFDIFTTPLEEADDSDSSPLATALGLCTFSLVPSTTVRCCISSRTRDTSSSNVTAKFKLCCSIASLSLSMLDSND